MLQGDLTVFSAAQAARSLAQSGGPVSHHSHYQEAAVGAPALLAVVDLHGMPHIGIPLSKAA